MMNRTNKNACESVTRGGLATTLKHDIHNKGMLLACDFLMARPNLNRFASILHVFWHAFLRAFLLNIITR